MKAHEIQSNLANRKRSLDKEAFKYILEHTPLLYMVEKWLFRKRTAISSFASAELSSNNPCMVSCDPLLDINSSHSMAEKKKKKEKEKNENNK